MATPRSLLVDSAHPLHYHLVSSCVRRASLCGWDKVTRKDYTYRKSWIEQRLFHLAEAFAVEIHGYAVMSNHLHVVVYYDPRASASWSDEEVAERWCHASLSTKNIDDPAILQRMKDALLSDDQRLKAQRKRLGSLSDFMQQLKQPIARRANLEDGVKGHFFQERFYSGALLDEQALLTAMAYVDLNPVRAKIAHSIEQCRYTSIEKRLKVLNNTPERLEQAMAPLASGLRTQPGHDPAIHEAIHAPDITLGAYTAMLRSIIAIESESHAHREPTERDNEARRWSQRVASLNKSQRAYGTSEQLTAWLSARNMRALEHPLP